MVVSNSLFVLDILKFDNDVDVILSEELQCKSIHEMSINSLTMENKRRQSKRGKSPRNYGNSKNGRSKSVGRI